jgi:FHA domain
MSEDRTIPMKKQPSQEDEGDQKTILSGQDKPMPPAPPYQPQESWQPPRDAGFVRTGPAEGVTPPPFPASQRPFAPPAAQDQTMIIAERPKPVFAWLVVVDGPDRNTIGTVHSLHPDTTTIGRVTGNQVVLHDETVSSQHARIRREGKEDQEAVFVLFDMGSANGIFAGKRETYKNDECRVYRHELKDGDYLLMGQTTLVFKRL